MSSFSKESPPGLKTIRRGLQNVLLKEETEAFVESR